jgi:hypothetical protein
MNGLERQEIYLIDTFVSVLVFGGFSPFLVDILDEFGLNFMGCILVSGFCFHFFGFLIFYVLVHEKSDFRNQFFLYVMFIFRFYFILGWFQ